MEIQGDSLIATIEPHAFPDITVTLECELAGDNRCTGLGRYSSTGGDDAGEWKLTGRRLGAAGYRGLDHDLPVRSLDVSGDHVTMVVAGTMADGQSVEATFAGTVAGDLVKGTVTIRAGGESSEVPFEGTVAME